MAPTYLPRVGVFPIVGEKSIVTLLGTGLSIPASVQDDCPLIGKQAPEISLPDHLGRRCSLRATIALGRPIILFFFPLAGSPHCTKESCLFRDALGLTPIFADLQAIVIGISQDPPNRSKRFVDEHHLGYRILHDENREAMNTYGVPRTMLGMVDQRCTFIIDPSGFIRAMVQGVLDANGHVTFAEKWLIRLEHELSQRSKKILAYEHDKTKTLMTDPTSTDSNGGGWTRVTYGDEDSANIGGIDAAPRHGAASMASKKEAITVPNYSRRLINAPYLSKDPTLYVPIGEAATHDEPSIISSASSSTKSTAKEKNIWKHWKSVFKELSSADDKPPPLVLSRNWEKATEPNGKAKSIRSSRRSFSGASTTNGGIQRTKSSSRLKDLAKSGIRRGSVTGQTMNEINASKDTFGNSVFSDPSNDVPAVPPLFAPLEAAAVVAQQNTPQSVHSTRLPRTSMIDSESSDRDASTGGTESSLSSHVSTAATSLMGGASSHGSLRYTGAGIGGGNAIPLANGVKQYQLARPAVTSEVLMPGEVLDLHQGSLPTVIKPASSQLLQQLQSNSNGQNHNQPHHPAVAINARSTSTPTTPNQSIPRPFVSRKPAPTQHEILDDSYNKRSPVSSLTGDSPNRPSVAPPRPVRVSSRGIGIGISRPSTSSSSLTAPTELPQDVPQDEGVQDDEEYVRQTDDGRIQILERPSPLASEIAVGESKHLHTVEQIDPKASVNGGRNSIGSSNGELSAYSTPRLRLTDEDQFESSSPSPRLAQQKQPSLREIRAQRHRSSSITDGIYRIHTPTLADAIATEINHDQDQDGRSSLSPRPRSAVKTFENGVNGGVTGHVNGGMNGSGRETPRLRRPLAAPSPKDASSSITRQLSKSSIGDSSSVTHLDSIYSSSPSSSDHHYTHSPISGGGNGTIQKVVRKANLRTDQPIIIDSSKITASSIGDVPPRPAPPIPIGAIATTTIKNQSPIIESELLAANDFGTTPPGIADDIRRPSVSTVSSMGTFGRRGSDLME